MKNSDWKLVRAKLKAHTWFLVYITMRNFERRKESKKENRMCQKLFGKLRRARKEKPLDLGSQRKTPETGSKIRTEDKLLISPRGDADPSLCSPFIQV